MPSETEVLAARLARMKSLVDALEKERASSAEERDKFLKLKQEIDAARAALRLIQS